MHFGPRSVSLPNPKANLQLNGLTNLSVAATCVAHVTANADFEPRNEANEGIGKSPKETASSIPEQSR
jgi:hypothetical protein